MIGLLKLHPGARLGNNLFNYHFLYQAAQKAESEVFHLEFPDSAYFENMEKKLKSYSRLSKKVRFNAEQIVEMSPQDFIHEIQNAEKKGRTVILEQPLLGELFFEYLFTDPKEIIRLRPEYQELFTAALEKNIDRSLICIHFRGTDFYIWDKNAILDYTYYEESLKTCLEDADKQPFVILTSDDRSLESYNKTIDYLKSNTIPFNEGELHKHFIYDFITLMACDYLISTPSTFCFWAAVIGKEKKIIQNKGWMDYNEARDIKFWMDMRKSTHTAYTVWKEL